MNDTEYGLLIPKKNADKSTKDPGGSNEFSKAAWDKQEIKKEDYERVKENLKNQMSAISKLPEKDNLYLRVELESEAKTKRPKQLWKESKLEVVEIRRDSSLTVAGSKKELSQLEELLNSSSYEDAVNKDDHVKKSSMNLSREFFAVSAVSDMNTGIADRVDENILTHLADRGNEQLIECIIELHPNTNVTTYHSLYKLISRSIEGSVIQRETQYMFSNFYYLAQLSISDIEKLLTDIELNYIRVIRKAAEFTAQRSIGSINLSDIKILAPLTDLKVGIVDSGVDSEYFNALKKYHKKETTLPENKSHGTFVASKVLFGYDLDQLAAGKTKTLEPLCRFIDLQVLGEKTRPEGGVSLSVFDTLDIVKAITNAIERFPEIKVYNISIADSKEADYENLDNLTVALDTLSHKHDVLFVVAAGNHLAHLSLSYDQIFKNKVSHGLGVAAPGDSINSLTIGSVVYKTDDSSMAKIKHYPSPFSRIGNMRGGVRKPELVEVGGNFKDFSHNPEVYDEIKENISKNEYGVVGLRKDKLDNDIGTSMSAPMVSHQAILAQDYATSLSSTINIDGNMSNIIRALLVHSTAKVEQADIKDPDIQLAYGAGLPNFDEIFSGSDNKVSILYCGEVDMKNKIHKLKFKFPSHITSGNSKYTFTFAYNPPVNSANLKEYNQITLQPSLRVCLPDQVDSKGKTKHPSEPIARSSDWKNLWKQGGTCLHFTSVKKGKLATEDFEVRIAATMADEMKLTAGKETEDVKQKYAFLLTIEDLDKNGSLREEINQLNEFEIVSRTKIQIQN